MWQGGKLARPESAQAHIVLTLLQAATAWRPERAAAQRSGDPAATSCIMPACFLPAPHQMHPILKQMHVNTGLINTEAGDAGSYRVVYQQCKLAAGIRCHNSIYT